MFRDVDHTNAHELPTNIIDHLRQEQQRNPEATGALTSILSDLARVAKGISFLVNTAGISEMYGLTGDVNVHGENVLKLDDQANRQFKNILFKNPFVAGFASEEEESFVPFDPNPRRKYILWFDPLDGSSNFDTNVSIGSIFAIYRRISDPSQPVNETDFLQPGRNQVCAGYFLYGSSTMLVYTTGNGVYGFTLDPRTGEFVLPKNYNKIQTPAKSTIYSVNESNSAQWNPEILQFINLLKNLGLSARYVGSLVADFHRNVLKGGVFLYPADAKHPNGKLRLNCELNPLAFVAEQAGGQASSGEARILDIQPTSLHQRSKVIIGSPREVELFLNKK